MPVAVIAKLNGEPKLPAAVRGLLLMTGATPAAAIVIPKVAVPVPEPLLAYSATFVVPIAVGVPVMAPVEELKVKPAGSVLTLKLVGDWVAAIVKVNGEPTLPAAVSGVLVMTGEEPAEATVMARVALPVPKLFVAPSVTFVVPIVVGAPVMAPVEVLKLRPAGSELALKLVGDWVAVMVKVKEDPTVAAAVSGEFVMTGEDVAMPVALKLCRSILNS